VEAVDRLLSLCPPLDVTDPETFITGLVAVLNRYPDEVVAEACGPTGIPMRIGAIRDLARVAAVCDELLEPVTRRLERERIANTPRLPAQGPRTPEEQAAIDAQVQRVRAQFGLEPVGTGYPVVQNGNGWATQG
jgi:hypothetical protein